MQFEQLTVEPSTPPFPIYDDPIRELLRAHATESTDRDSAAAHILGVLSGYAYADTATVAMMVSQLAFGTGFCPTTAAGACSQRPTQGAAITRTSRPSRAGSLASRSLAPAISQDSPSQTRTVSAGGTASPSLTTSK